MDRNESYEVERGQRGRKRMPFSEAAMHIGVAGHYMDFELLDRPYPGVQLYKDGHPYSGSITTGEAGIFSRNDGTFYYYPHEHNGENMEKCDPPVTPACDSVTRLSN